VAHPPVTEIKPWPKAAPISITRITAEIVSAIEHGAGEWRMPWNHDGTAIARPRNVSSDKGYRGINVLTLWITAQRAGYPSGIWGTYRQWSEFGCQVRRGEKAATVMFWKQTRQNDRGEEETDNGNLTDNDDREDRPRFFARGYCVFNASQVDGYVRPAVECLAESERLARQGGGAGQCAGRRYVDRRSAD
jgi:antirestriction protein ArdC